MNVDFIIDDDTPNDLIFPSEMGRGYVERDFAVDPPEMFAPPSEMDLIPRSEWSARIKEQEREKTRISDILLRAGIPSLDQSSSKYCWGHSTVGSVQALRAINNLPHVPLSAYAVCAIIMRGKSEGAWCGLSAKFLREVGVPSQELWPQGSYDLRHDTPAMRANAALHKVTEDWVDLARPVYDQNLTFDQVATCLLKSIPCAIDENWWAHSIMACDLVEVEAGSFGIRIRNSWGDQWGDKGFAVLRGNKALPNGAVALRVTGGSAS